MYNADFEGDKIGDQSPGNASIPYLQFLILLKNLDLGFIDTTVSFEPILLVKSLPLDIFSVLYYPFNS